MGYDIGWFPECYSLISDWHGPDPADFHELGERLRPANHHGLFHSADDARAFRSYYVSRPWAETEDMPFRPIAVELVSTEP